MTTVATAHQKLLIGGEWVDAVSGATFEVRNPFNGALSGTVAAGGREDAALAVEAAARAFPAWSGATLAERRAVLDRAADLLMERQADIAQIVTDETGGTFGWGMFNVQLAASMLREAGAQAASTHDQEIASHVPGKEARAVRQPVGVVVGIAPWNAPVILGTRAVASPLAYGNTVVLKASEAEPAHARGDRPGARRRRRAGRRDQPGQQRPGGRRGRRRRAGRAARGPADQLHRLDARRAPARRERRAPPQARAARARRQGADDRARRRRSRPRGRSGDLRRLHEPGPDLHVDRAHRRRPDGR